MTTNGHELALAVVYESGLQHYADSVASYRDTPDYVQEMLRDVPAAWDETRFIAGYPGEFVVLARRIDHTWYLAGLNGLKETRTLDLPLEFLAGPAEALIVTDGEDASWRSETGSFVPSDQFKLTMYPAGGFLARFEPAPGTED